ncbi:MAG: GspH/FimT family pseudopilin [Methylococcus sp.]
MRKTSGFTLIELMVTLAVAAIVLTVGIPSFREFIERNRVSAYTNRLVGALQLARSEAIKRGRHVTLCNYDSNKKECKSDGAWQDGWQLYVNEASGDVLIQLYEAMPGLTITGGVKFACWIGFGPSGNPEASLDASCQGDTETDFPVGNGSFTLCSSRLTATHTGRKVVINPVGRIRTEDTTC